MGDLPQPESDVLSENLFDPAEDRKTVSPSGVAIPADKSITGSAESVLSMKSVNSSSPQDFYSSSSSTLQNPHRHDNLITKNSIKRDYPNFAESEIAVANVDVKNNKRRHANTSIDEDNRGEKKKTCRNSDGVLKDD